MELKEHKSALAALATLGVTAVAAGATAFLKIRKNRKERKEREEEEINNSRLTPDQMMVYNEAVRAFMTLNNHIYELRRFRKELQPLIKWLATNGEKPKWDESNVELNNVGEEIANFLTMQVPFINASLCMVSQEGLTYADIVHAPVNGTFNAALDEEPTGAIVEKGTPVTFVLRLGYLFPESTIAVNPVKAIVLV